MYALQPRVYIIGPSQDADDCCTAERKVLNLDGEFIFVQRETSLMRNVDGICKELATKEKVMNLLFLSVGILESGRSKYLGVGSETLFVSLTPRRNRRRAVLLGSFDSIWTQAFRLELVATAPAGERLAPCRHYLWNHTRGPDRHRGF